MCLKYDRAASGTYFMDSFMWKSNIAEQLGTKHVHVIVLPSGQPSLKLYIIHHHPSSCYPPCCKEVYIMTLFLTLLSCGVSLRLTAANRNVNCVILGLCLGLTLLLTCHFAGKLAQAGSLKCLVLNWFNSWSLDATKIQSPSEPNRLSLTNATKLPSHLLTDHPQSPFQVLKLIASPAVCSTLVTNSGVGYLCETPVSVGLNMA